MYLEPTSGRMYYNNLEITPPHILTKEWESDLKIAFPEIKSGAGDYQKWAFRYYYLDNLLVLNEYYIKIVFSFKSNWTIGESAKFEYLRIHFTEAYLETKLFKGKKLKYSEKLRMVKSRYVEFLEAISKSNLKLEKRNKITFPDWGSASLLIEKKIYYRLNINWKKL